MTTADPTTTNPTTTDPTTVDEATAVPAAEPTRTPRVRIRGLRKAFDDKEILRGIDLDVRAGEVVAIIGPSGSGKSTLLRTINHLERPTTGLVRVDGEIIGYRQSGTKLYALPEAAILRQRSKIGFVFQHFNLFPHLTALENVSLAPIHAKGLQQTEDVRRQARDLLERVGLGDRVDHYPRQLSGGQQQRVAIARALALQPELILFDEPTSALDPELVGEVLDVIADLAREGRTLIIVTHEIAFARRVADRLIFIDDGRILESGPPAEVLDNPQHDRTREFLSRVL